MIHEALSLVDDPLKTSHLVIEELRRWYGIIGDDFLTCKYQEKANTSRISLSPTTPTKEISVLKCPE